MGILEAEVTEVGAVAGVEGRVGVAEEVRSQDQLRLPFPGVVRTQTVAFLRGVGKEDRIAAAFRRGAPQKANV